MRVTIVGQKWFGVEVLKAARARGLEIAGVCAPPGDRLASAAQAAGVRAIEAVPGDLPECDLGIAAHAHTFVGARSRARARLGFVGYHPSLLPRHRGRDAVRRAVHMREPIAGGTLYRMTDVVDGGPILAQAWCHVRPEWTAEALWREALAPLGVTLFDRLFASLAAGADLADGEPQDETLAAWEPAFDRPKLAAAGGER